MKTIFKVAVVLACVLSFARAEAADMLNGAGATFPYPVVLGVGL